MSNELTASPAWAALQNHAASCKTHSIRSFFKDDPQRFEHFSLNEDGLLYDYSRQHVTPETMSLLMNLARQQDVESWREKMFSGFHVNYTEDRAVLHTAMRRPDTDHLEVDGVNIMQGISDVRARLKFFCQDVHSGKIHGFTGKKFKTIVNIGIGGSDLGPYMVCEALRPWKKDNIETYFVSNVDGTHISETLKKVDPETTLFLVASKTFTTQETMTNAETAKDWLIKHLGNEDAIAFHFAAMSTNLQAVQKFGLNPDFMFPFENWVGGRFSLWSSIGLSIALNVGYENFERLLSGAHAMDKHFQTTPMERNLPVLMALLGIWNRNFLEYPCLAILPYDQYLHSFATFLQQLDMESNGKYLNRTGIRTDYMTGPTLYGEPGTNGQHAFFQLLHQGTEITPCDFIASLRSQNPIGSHHKLLLANMVAQAEAMANGRTLAEAKGDIQRAFEGNRPSSILLFDEMTPYHLGRLIALYEHKIFVQGIIWEINSFDQFGVELGKELATKILSGEANETSKIGILQYIQKHS